MLLPPKKQTQAKRLAFFLPDLGGGGAERVVLTLIKGFIKRGFEVDLVLGSRTGSLLPLIPAGTTVFDLGSPRLRHAVRGLVQYLKVRRPAALHAMMWPSPVIAIIAKSIARVSTRVIGSEHVVLSKTPMALKKRLFRNITKWAYLKADKLIVVSDGVGDDLSAFIGLPKKSIVRIYNPLTLPENLPSIDIAARCWRAGTKKILAVGELKAEKNYSLLIDAMALLRERDSLVSLLILGEGTLEESLKRQVATIGLEDCVIFAGFAHDVWPYYSAADVFVLSSNVEGFGNVLVEAMHAGTPVVSTDCLSGPREILAGGDFGALVPCDNPTALAQALHVALAAPHDPEVLRRRASALSGSDSIDKHLAVMLGEAD